MPTTRMNGQVGKAGSVNGTANIGSTNLSQQQQRQESGKLANSSQWPQSVVPTPDETATLTFREERMAYFRNHYDLMTGVRIAGTLGGFFLIVLLTLLYKSKCKKSSQLPTPILSMDKISQVLINNPLKPLTPDFCSTAQESRLLMSEVGGSCWERPELLLTSPIDLQPESSSDDDASSLNFSARLTLDLPNIIQTSVTKKRKLISPLKDSTFLNQPIDIHIIQPTPSISPSHSDIQCGGGTNNPGRVTVGQGVPSQFKRSLVTPRDSDSEVNSPLLLFLHAENFKYADDSSSENLPTRGSDEEIESPSIGSDSVFTFARDRRRSSMSIYTGLEIEDEENCGGSLSQGTTALPRDSFSEIESDYMEGRQRRSSSTQTTISDIRRLSGVSSQQGQRSSGGISGSDTPYLNVYHLSPAQSGRVLSSSPTQSAGKLLNPASFQFHGTESTPPSSQSSQRAPN